MDEKPIFKKIKIIKKNKALINLHKRKITL